MKILHVIPGYYPAIRYGGPTESVHLLNMALAKQGIYVDVLTTDSGIKDRNDIVLNEWVYHKGVRIKYLRCYFSERYAFSPSVFNLLLRQTKNYDLVHLTALWSFPVLAGACACMICKRPYIVSPRGVLYNEAINLKSKELKKLYYSLMLGSVLEKATAWHFTASHERDNVSPMVSNCINESKSIVIPNGIDLNDYENLPVKGSFKKRYPGLGGNKYILFLGRLNKKKGLDILVEAFREILQVDNKCYLVIAGPDDGYEKTIKNILNSYKISDRVIFTGILKGENKLAAYVDAELFVLPSYSENFGMSIVEAMACGTPVIISNRVGICDDIEEFNAGIVVAPIAKLLVSGIRNLLTNPTLSREISINAKRLIVEKYDIDKVASLMINAYQSVLQNQ